MRQKGGEIMIKKERVTTKRHCLVFKCLLQVQWNAQSRYSTLQNQKHCAYSRDDGKSKWCWILTWGTSFFTYILVFFFFFSSTMVIIIFFSFLLSWSRKKYWIYQRNRQKILLLHVLTGKAKGDLSAEFSQIPCGYNALRKKGFRLPFARPRHVR